MKRKIRSICIDGMEKTGKTSVIKEMRKFLKNKEFDFFEINGTDEFKLNKQEIILNDNTNAVILKENGILHVFYEELKQFKGVRSIQKKHQEIIRREILINHQHGEVHFFLLPENSNTVARIFGSNMPPSYYNNLMDFYMGIKSMSLTQGLDIQLIPFNEHDRIFDVRDKILKILEEKYEI